MDEMASQNLDISCATTVVQFRTVKAGGHVTMGVSAQTIHNLLLDTHVAILYVVNREQFMALQGVDPAPPEPVEQPRRSLASLTEDEAKTVFALAFGYGAINFRWNTSIPKTGEAGLELAWVESLGTRLIIQGNGYMVASELNSRVEEDYRGFNARKVLTYLALLGIAWKEA